MSRISKLGFYAELVNLISLRSTCLSRKVGAVVVKDDFIISTGFNGAPSKFEHCKDCLRHKLKVPSGERHEICRGVHAEQNALIQAAKFGISVENADMYCTTQPCIICTKLIINSGIKNVYYFNRYNDELAIEFQSQTSVNFQYIGD